MSAIQEFNSLGGKIVSREELEALNIKAFNEISTNKNSYQDKLSGEVSKRVIAILNKYPKAKEFEFEKNAIKKIDENSKLGIPVKLQVYSKQIDKDLVFFYGEKKLATIKPNGLIDYETSRLPRGARNRIRKASATVGLNSPIDVDMLHGLELLPDEDYGLGKPVSQNEIYDYVTDLIINTINEVGHLPWQKEWVGSGSDGEAKNYVTKRPYSGINFLLNFELKKGKNGKYYLVPINFTQPYYLTFNQIQEAKATLKKGSSARRVIYYTMIFNYKDGDLEFSSNDREKFTAFIKSNGITAEQVKQNGYKIPIVKYYNVYRADDCTGLKFPQPKAKPESTPIEQAQEIIDGYPNPPKYTFVGSDAAYYPIQDKINMPKITAFKVEASYYCTFFHEMIHSTGHSKRLNRGNDTRTRDGSEADKKAYAFEELVAELGAVYLCSDAGILFTTIDNSAKYLKGWHSRLISEMENDNRFFFKASAQAQKAANHILNRDEIESKPKNVKKVTKTVTKKAKTVTKKPKSVKKPAVKEQIPAANNKTITVRKNSAEFKEVINWKVFTLYNLANNFSGESITNGLSNFDKSNAKITKSNGIYTISIHSNKWFTAERFEAKKPVKKTNNLSDQFKKAAEKRVTEKQTPKSYDKKPKSVSVATAIKDVLTLPKYKGVKLLLATIIYNKFKNFDDSDFFEVQISSPYEKGVLKTESDLHDFFEYAEELSLTEKGLEFVKAVNGRLESLRNQKNNYAMFDNLGNHLKPIKLTAAQKKRYDKELASENWKKYSKTIGKKKKPVKKSVLGNSEHIEVIEPTPIIPIAIELPVKNEIVETEKVPTASVEPQKKNRLMSMTFETLPMRGKFENLMQHPAKNLKIGIFGKPKNGKTAGSLQLAEYLTQFGKVLYNFADQGFNLSTQMLWKESGLENNSNAEPSDISTLDELEKEIATGKYGFVFIDLINDYIDKEKISPQDFKDRFIRKYDNVGFILVFESTKGGDFKGDQKWMHVVDAIANVEDFVMTMRGRYGNGEFLIWEKGLKDVNPKRYQEWLENHSETTEFEEISFNDEVETI